MPAHRARASHIKETALIKKAKKDARRRKVLGLIIVIAILIVAVFVGYFSYNKILNDKLSQTGSNAKESLVSASKNDAVYTLIKVDADKDESVKESYGTKENTTLYFLMRSDSSNSCVSFLFFPTNLSVTLSDKKTHPLYQSETYGGDAELISVINDFCDVKINHIIQTSAQGIAQLVDNVGGIEVELDHEIDDPYAGYKTLHAGNTTLNSEGTTTLLRARNVSGSYDTIAKNLSSFSTALMTKLTTSVGFDFAKVIEQFANSVTTDMQLSDFTNFAEKFSSDKTVVYNSTLCGSISKSSDTSEIVFVSRQTENKVLIDKFKEGNDPRDTNVSTTAFDKSQVHIEVRNGAQITGAAGACGTFLSSAGYVVDTTRNTEDGTTYSETLIIYLGDEFENAANSIMNELGCGRVVNGGDYYTSSSNVIVIIGLDWSQSS